MCHNLDLTQPKIFLHNNKKIFLKNSLNPHSLPRHSLTSKELSHLQLLLFLHLLLTLTHTILTFCAFTPPRESVLRMTNDLQVAKSKEHVSVLILTSEQSSTLSTASLFLKHYCLGFCYKILFCDTIIQELIFYHLCTVFPQFSSFYLVY